MTSVLDLGRMLAAHARLSPQRIGACDLERSMTFDQWNSRACRLANALAPDVQLSRAPFEPEKNWETLAAQENLHYFDGANFWRVRSSRQPRCQNWPIEKRRKMRQRHARMTLNGATLLRSRPKSGSKAAGIRRRRAERKQRVEGG